MLSFSGVTGDPDNLQGNLPSPPWQRACALATQVAQAVVNQNTIGRVVANTVTVTFLYNGATTDCTAGGAFAVNPQVKVDVVQRGLPTFFSRIWNRSPSQVSATATAEAFNPSYSSTLAPNGLTTVTPRCVKPWVVPNHDPINSGDPFVMPDGSIKHPGIQINGTGPGAVIGETFELVDDCKTGNPHCKALDDAPPTTKPPNLLEYVPASIGGTTVGVPSCSTGSPYQEAVRNHQNTVYACGIVGGGAQLDLTFNPGKASGDTATAIECLIRQSAGQDVLDTTNFPFQLQPGAGNPMLLANPGLTNVSRSNSIVTLPIYDGAAFSTSVSPGRGCRGSGCRPAWGAPLHAVSRVAEVRGAAVVAAVDQHARGERLALDLKIALVPCGHPAAVDLGNEATESRTPHTAGFPNEPRVFPGREQ